MVTEIYAPEHGGWIVLDPSMDGYVAGDNGRTLSVLAIRVAGLALV